jgi:hypothetical protein
MFRRHYWRKFGFCAKCLRRWGYIFTAGSLQQNTALAQQAQLELDAVILAVNGMGPGLTRCGPYRHDLAGHHTVPPVPLICPERSFSMVGAATAQWVFLFLSTLSSPTVPRTFRVTNAPGDGSGVGIYWSVGSARGTSTAMLSQEMSLRDLSASDGNLTRLRRAPFGHHTSDVDSGHHFALMYAVPGSRTRRL